MRKSLWIDVLKLVVIFGAVWALLAIFPIFSDAPELKFSVESEEKLGELIVEELLKDDPNFKEINNPVLDSAMLIINRRLLHNVGMTDYQYHIRVVNNPQVNAFTLPGGNIFVLSGLIKFSENPEEIAAVLSHEIGHVEKRHVVSNLIRELGLTILISVLSNGDPIIITEVAKTLLSAKFSRDQESEADKYGLDLLDKSSVTPLAMASFFRRLEREKGTYNKSMEILMSHPHVNSRIKASMEYKTSTGFKSQGFDMDWKAVKGSLGTEEN
jgi:beta-barrel assembly-enhancing protease